MSPCATWVVLALTMPINKQNIMISQELEVLVLTYM